MLRRASLQVDISGINDAGLTPLHQAVLDGNEAAVRLLVTHGADINKQDEDSWTLPAQRDMRKLFSFFWRTVQTKVY
ncbi:hypothetical protein DPMN_088981 [Dreissena polymorpha]|uniref:Uncharacterized protein n=1 Tax=Dreissena polymorpha TaxID=45954 RepID=A0A9D4KW30_DREPO|nr:hypothetical protein DPMN_088981 [Dreissena polymorpha]